VQRLIDAALIGAERAATLQHEHDLPVIDVADFIGGFKRGKASGGGHGRSSRFLLAHRGL
jgi:hypothetical protein